MKILIASEIAPRRVGSYERYHFGVSRALQQRGHEVVSLFSGSMSDPVCERFLVADDRVITELGDGDSPSSRRAWIDRIRRERPDVVWLHFFSIYGPFIDQLRRAVPHALICQTDHVSRGPARRGPARWIVHRLRAAAYSRRIDRHFAVSRFIADRLIQSDKIPADRVATIINGVDIQAFQPSPNRGPYLSAICYMRPEKGIRILIEALAILKARGLEPPCRLIGDGPSLPEHRSQAREYELDHVEFLGLRDDVDDLMRDSMLTVVPSTWPEAFSYSAAESQACGVPVVASAVGGLPEVVEDGVTGRLVPPGQPQALADAIESILRDPARMERMGHDARRRAERYFNLQDKIEQSVRLLDPSHPLASE